MATNGHGQGQGPGQPQATPASVTPLGPSRPSGSRLGELLLRRAVITADQLAAVATEQTKHGGQFAATLVKLGFISDDDLTAYLHKEYRLPVIDPMSVEPTSEVLSLIPDTLARKHEILPISLAGSTLTLAMADPSNLVALGECKFLTGCDVRIVLASARSIQKAIDRHYNERAKAYSDALTRLDNGDGIHVLQEEEAIDLAALQKAVEEAPLVKLVNALMTDAVERRASDIHIEPFEHDLRIRFRIDGILYDIMQPPPRFKAALASRIKIMASLDISERRLPQDGAIKIRLQTGKEVSFRVSSLPTVNGEKLVLRLMDKTGLQLDLTKLGFEEQELHHFQSAISRPYGMVLITGPTGSGKTTTLYSLLAEINKSVRNIQTAEDPVELNMHGINQVQVNEEIGLTFASSLRAFLRQDPDVIMVGEVRDYETAEIAVKAALTGHLVLSTLHTNDAPSSVTRLLDMGVEPFLVSSSVVLVAAQRLVRLVCPSCRVAAEPRSAESLLEIGFNKAELKNLKLYHGRGCDECADTGYRGRIALYEVLPITDEIRDMVVARAHAVDIRRKSMALGMRTLRESGLDKVRRGMTTVEEVLRVTGVD
jgi:type IV pilus assembly protein PilB